MVCLDDFKSHTIHLYASLTQSAVFSHISITICWLTQHKLPVSLSPTVFSTGHLHTLAWKEPVAASRQTGRHEWGTSWRLEGFYEWARRHATTAQTSPTVPFALPPPLQPPTPSGQRSARQASCRYILMELKPNWEPVIQVSFVFKKHRFVF